LFVKALVELVVSSYRGRVVLSPRRKPSTSSTNNVYWMSNNAAAAINGWAYTAC